MSSDVFENAGAAVIDRRYNAVISLEVCCYTVLHRVYIGWPPFSMMDFSDRILSKDYKFPTCSDLPQLSPSAEVRPELESHESECWPRRQRANVLSPLRGFCTARIFRLTGYCARVY